MPPPGRGGGFKKGGFKKGQSNRSFGDRPGGERGGSGGGRKSFGDRPAAAGFKKSFGDRPFKKFSSDRPGGGEGGFKKSFGDRPFKKFSGDRPGGGEGGFKKPFGDRPFKKFGGDRPGGGEGGFKKSFGDRPPKAFRPGGDRDRPFKKPFDRDRGDRGGGGRPAFARPAPGQERVAKYEKRDVPQGVLKTTPTKDGRWVWGVNPVLETLRAHPDQVEQIYMVDGVLGSSAAAEILSRAREAGLDVKTVERERLTSMIGGGVHQGIVAEVKEYQYKELEDLLDLAKASNRPPLIVVLDGIQDPHNLGAIIRSAHSFGAHGVVIAKDRAAGVTGLVAKSSAGAIEHCPVARVVNVGRALEQLKEAGCWTVAADPEGAQPAWTAKLDGPLAIVVGAEGPGVRDGVLSKCDFKVLIPMSGQVASLNASVSAGVLLYEVARQRAASGPS